MRRCCPPAHRRCSNVVSDDKRPISRQERLLLQRNRFVSDCDGVCHLRPGNYGARFSGSRPRIVDRAAKSSSVNGGESSTSRQMCSVVLSLNITAPGSGGGL